MAQKRAAENRTREVRDIVLKFSKAVILLSGGVDSTTLLYQVRKSWDVYALSFDYGQKHSKELTAATLTCLKLKVPHKIIDLTVLGEIAPSALTRDNLNIPEGHYEDENMKMTVVPNRNGVLLNLCASYAIGVGADTIFYGAHGGDHAIYPDCRPEFVESTQKALSLCDWNPIRLEVPFLLANKAQIVNTGLKLGVDYALTWTCYKGKDKACGKCGSCQERLEAFKMNGAVDPIEYE